jgi:uncharacterized repeat protein (TIGR03803 family)
MASLVLSGGTLFGTTISGGSANAGTVFAVSTNGTGFRVLHTFPSSSEGTPYSQLLLVGDTLYGTAGGWPGSVFSLSTNGVTFKLLHSFTTPSGSSSFLGFPTNSDGCAPFGGLILSGETLYGTASRGGATSGQGTVFALGTNGMGFRTLHSFTVATDGGSPTATLILRSNMLYGTLEGTDAYEGGIFALSTNGTGFTILHAFTGGSEGAWPWAGVIMSGETLFGTASGATSISINGNGIQGAVFRLKVDGTDFTNLHLFTLSTGPDLTNTDGEVPQGTLLLEGDTLYGIATVGGAGSGGTLFTVKTNGTGFTVLYNFSGPGPSINGHNPMGGMILSGNTLYGTTARGGTFDKGTVFSFSLTPVKPHITQQPLNRTNIAGTTASFSVVANGPPTLSYQWLKGTNAIPRQSNFILALTNIMDADAGLYSVVVSNAAGSVTSTPATLTVIDPPHITRQPLSLTNIAGTSAIFSVVVSGTPPLAYQWLKGVNPISQQRTATLILTNVSDADAATYSVVVTNVAGTTTSSPATLSVIDQPTMKFGISGKSMVLTWPANASGFTLQSTTNLDSAIWTANVLPPFIEKGQYIVTNSVSGNQRFFRLHLSQ